MKKNKLLLIGLPFLLLAIFVYARLFSSNTDIEGKKYLCIPTGSNYEQMIQIIKDSQIVSSLSSFEWLAAKMNLDKSVHPGRYEFESGMGNYTMVSMLKAGKQKPVKLVLNKLRTKKDIIKKLTSQLEADSTEMATLLNDANYLKQWDIDSNQIQCIIMPATYEFYWNTTSPKVIEKIAKTYEKFWNSDRREKAKQLNISIPQVITIASIVEEETNQNDEKPTIASVYLNRYKLGMKLGADPTVKFAVGDFGLKRILNVHTQYPSPYNTYFAEGIPPGPICTPSKESIEAVLNPASTKFLFFCAREDFNGHHNFAVTYSEHLANAKRYQQALDKRGIK
jgi:UPF0755 protein